MTPELSSGTDVIVDGMLTYRFIGADPEDGAFAFCTHPTAKETDAIASPPRIDRIALVRLPPKPRPDETAQEVSVDQSSVSPA